MAASVTAGFVRRRRILAAYDMRECFMVTVVMTTIWLMNRSSLGTFRVVKSVARLVVRSRLRLFVLVMGCVLLLLSCGVVLLKPITGSACVVFVWVFRFKITDYGVIVTKLMTNCCSTGGI